VAGILEPIPGGKEIKVVFFLWYKYKIISCCLLVDKQGEK
jgi:hypothetical protein